MNPLRIALVGGACLVAAGCQRPTPPSAPTETRVTAASDAQYAALWEACLATCRRNCFTPDRRDRRAGIITTKPETSAYPLEFWRERLATPYDRAETMFHTIRRALELRITADDDSPGEYTVQVLVHKERMHAAERQVNNAAGGLRVFSPGTPTTRGRRFDPNRDAYWSSAGRDGAFERRLLEQIMTAYADATGDPRVAKVDAAPPTSEVDPADDHPAESGSSPSP